MHLFLSGDELSLNIYVIIVMKIMVKKINKQVDEIFYGTFR